MWEFRNNRTFTHRVKVSVEEFQFQFQFHSKNIPSSCRTTATVFREYINQIIDRIFQNFHRGYFHPLFSFIPSKGSNWSRYRSCSSVKISIRLHPSKGGRAKLKEEEEEEKSWVGKIIEGSERNYPARSNAADRFYSSERSGPKLEKEEGRKRKGRGRTDKVEGGAIPGWETHAYNRVAVYKPINTYSRADVEALVRSTWSWITVVATVGLRPSYKCA